jgi:anti-anti-sigma factor
MAVSLSSVLAPSSVPERTGNALRIEVGVREAPGEMVVRVAGEAGVKQAEELTAALLGLSACRPAQVTLDLAELSFVSSLAMGVLVSFRRGIVRAGGRVRLAEVLQQPVCEALERAGLLALLGFPGAAEGHEPAAAALGRGPDSPSHPTKREGNVMNHIPNIQDLERSFGVTWSELAGLEPRLNELLWQARAAGAGCRGWEHVDRLFAPFRDALTGLVGFQGRHSRHPVLGSVGAYEVTYWRLYDAVSGLLPRPPFPDAEEVDARSPKRRVLAARR